MAKPTLIETIRHGWKPPEKRPWSTGSPAPRGKGRKFGKLGKASSNGHGPTGKSVGQTELIAKREALARAFVELQWDLGGMAYEMASRDHFRLDVLNRQAAELQKVDAELGQIERMMKLDDAGAAGSCPSCGALQARGAVFCWQCGSEITSPTEPGKS
jgi:hypothetical protein